MKKTYYLFVLLLIIFSCNTTEIPTKFSEDVLNDTFVTLEGKSIPFKNILEKHKGQTLLIDIWASWCSDCIKNMPKVQALQQDYKEVTYIFLSLDKNKEAWKKGIKKYEVQGEHYFMQSGWDGVFGKFINLKWIPRYMIIDKKGEIKLFKAIKADDNRIKQHILNN